MIAHDQGHLVFTVTRQPFKNALPVSRSSLSHGDCAEIEMISQGDQVHRVSQPQGRRQQVIQFQNLQKGIEGRLRVSNGNNATRRAHAGTISTRVTAGETALLGVSAFLGGAINGIAGGGSFLTFPTLVFLGMPALTANATSTVALWPASVASALAYRKKLKATGVLLLVLLGVSLLGGTAGALLALATTEKRFALVVPFLMLLAVVLFTVQSRLPRGGAVADAGANVGSSLLRTAAAQFVISIYGGYFGGGMGLMMLATFSWLGMKHLHEMNALKTVLGIAINLAALTIFTMNGSVEWPVALLMAVAASLGGFASVALARKVPVARVRVVVIAIGWLTTLSFFYKTFA